MTGERRCYVSHVLLLSLVSLHEDLSFELVLKDWSTKPLLTQASSTQADLPSIDHRLELDWIRLWLMEALYLYVRKFILFPRLLLQKYD